MRPLCDTQAAATGCTRCRCTQIDELAQVGLSFLDGQRERFIAILEG